MTICHFIYMHLSYIIVGGDIYNLNGDKKIKYYLIEVTLTNNNSG